MLHRAYQKPFIKENRIIFPGGYFFLCERLVAPFECGGSRFSRPLYGRLERGRGVRTGASWNAWRKRRRGKTQLLYFRRKYIFIMTWQKFRTGQGYGRTDRGEYPPLRLPRIPQDTTGPRRRWGRTGAEVGNTVGNDSRPIRDKKEGEPQICDSPCLSW